MKIKIEFTDGTINELNYDSIIKYFTDPDGRDICLYAETADGPFGLAECASEMEARRVIDLIETAHNTNTEELLLHY